MAAINLLPHNDVNKPEEDVVCVEEESLLMFIEEMDTRYDKVIEVVQSMMFLVCNGEAEELQTKIKKTCDLMKDLKSVLRVQLPVSFDYSIEIYGFVVTQFLCPISGHSETYLHTGIRP